MAVPLVWQAVSHGLTAIWAFNAPTLMILE
jgi:hypothetical protein